MSKTAKYPLGNLRVNKALLIQGGANGYQKTITVGPLCITHLEYNVAIRVHPENNVQEDNRLRA